MCIRDSNICSYVLAGGGDDDWAAGCRLISSSVPGSTCGSCSLSAATGGGSFSVAAAAVSAAGAAFCAAGV
eukprot:7808704-Prorocentrum_lima.AAC.1